MEEASHKQKNAFVDTVKIFLMDGAVSVLFISFKREKRLDGILL